MEQIKDEWVFVKDKMFDTHVEYFDTESEALTAYNEFIQSFEGGNEYKFLKGTVFVAKVDRIRDLDSDEL